MTSFWREVPVRQVKPKVSEGLATAIRYHRYEGRLWRNRERIQDRLMSAKSRRSKQPDCLFPAQSGQTGLRTNRTSGAVSMLPISGHQLWPRTTVT